MTGGAASVVASLGGATAGTVDDPTGTNNAAVQFSWPAGVVAASGALFVADAGAHVIRRLRPQGDAYLVDTFQGVANTSGALDDTDGNAATLGARFNEPRGLAAFGNYLFVTETQNFRIRRIDLTTRDVVTVAGGNYGRADGTGQSARFGYPEWIAVDGAGVLYVSNRDPDYYSGIFDTGLVRRIAGALTATSPSGTTVTTIGGDITGVRGVKVGALPSRLNDVYGLAFTPKGDLAVVSENSVLVLR
jgi:hypothetical protein